MWLLWRPQSVLCFMLILTQTGQAFHNVNTYTKIQLCAWQKKSGFQYEAAINLVSTVLIVSHSINEVHLLIIPNSQLTERLPHIYCICMFWPQNENGNSPTVAFGVFWTLKLALNYRFSIVLGSFYPYAKGKPTLSWNNIKTLNTVIKLSNQKEHLTWLGEFTYEEAATCVDLTVTIEELGWMFLLVETLFCFGPPHW